MRKYLLNENYFDDIDNGEKAYFFGCFSFDKFEAKDIKAIKRMQKKLILMYGQSLFPTGLI